jgi:hypothetical protein
MARTITLRLSDTVYETVKRYAEVDQQSMNSWIEGLLDVEDMRRRCAAHDQWMSTHPDAVAFTEAWADWNLVDLGDDWAAPGLVTSLRKARLSDRRRRIDVQARTDVNNMLFKILATPER